MLFYIKTGKKKETYGWIKYSRSIKIKIIELCELLVVKDSAQSLTKLLSRVCAFLPHDELYNRFASLAKSSGIKSNASKFVSLSLEAMKNLQDAGKENLLLKFAQCVGVRRADGTDTLMPMGRMPLGLVEYQIKCFTCTNTQQVCLCFLYWLVRWVRYNYI